MFAPVVAEALGWMHRDRTRFFSLLERDGNQQQWPHPVGGLLPH